MSELTKRICNLSFNKGTEIESNTTDRYNTKQNRLWKSIKIFWSLPKINWGGGGGGGGGGAWNEALVFRKAG